MKLFDINKASNQLAIFLFVMGIGIMVSGVLLYVLSRVMQCPVEEMEYHASAMRVEAVLSQLMVFLLPSLALAAWVHRVNNAYYLPVNVHVGYANAGMAILLMLVSMPVLSCVVALNEAAVLPQGMHVIESWLREQEQTMALRTETLLKASRADVLAVNILVIALLPALCEEVLFRGVLVNWLHRLCGNMHVVIWLSAIVFSACHMQFYGFVPRMLLGAAFGYMVWWTGSLWTSVLAHGMNNAVVVIAAYGYHKGLWSDVYNSTAVSDVRWWAVAASVAATAAVLYLLYAYNRQHRELKP